MGSRVSPPTDGCEDVAYSGSGNKGIKMSSEGSPDGTCVSSFSLVSQLSLLGVELHIVQARKQQMSDIGHSRKPKGPTAE